MLFNSLEFFVFLPITFIIYWLFKQKTSIQNVIILVASYIFYGWWDWRFLSLIFISSLIDYSVGWQMHITSNQQKRKWLLGISLLANLGILGFFKYYNFFIHSLENALFELGLNMNFHTLKIILPVGISFYTFQTLSYTLDIYNKKLAPTRNAIDFFAFVSFFPQLVAGPIERASNLLPQFSRSRTFNYETAIQGSRMILWGLIKKVLIADTLAKEVEYIFANQVTLSGWMLYLGALYFAFQIYCDFSGYSDIAIGTARLFGFQLMTNFSMPYFSRNISEFWQRWHISLSTWFRDYVYIPLGGNRYGPYRQMINLLITFILSGLWHGANWTFVSWGFLHGLFYLPVVFIKNRKKYRNIVAQQTFFPSFQEMIAMLLTFNFTLVAWIFFRAENISHAAHYLSNMTKGIISSPGAILLYLNKPANSIIFLLLVTEWLQRKKQHTSDINHLPVYLRWVLYLLACIAIIFSISFHEPSEFIYFQF